MSTALAPGMIVTADLTDWIVPEEADPALLFCENNGTRRVVWKGGLHNLSPKPASEILAAYDRLRAKPHMAKLLKDTIPILGVQASAPPWFAAGHFVGYDGSRQIEPVNQMPDALTWLRHTTTFAHEIDSLYADHTHQLRQGESYRTLPDMPHNDESNMRNQNALQFGRGACGYVFDKVLLYSKLPPEQGGSGVLARDWKMQRAGVLEDVEELCLTCNHAHWLRQFIIKHDMITWRAALDELLVREADDRTFRYMRCPKIDKSSVPWQPASASITTFAGNAPLNWWKRQMVNYGLAVDYYDEHFSRRTSE